MGAVQLSLSGIPEGLGKKKPQMCKHPCECASLPGLPVFPWVSVSICPCISGCFDPCTLGLWPWV